MQSHGRIDVLINNAGLMPHSPLERGKIADWERMIDVNVKGVLYGIAAALPHMKAPKGGHIINVSSVAGHTVRPGGAVYSATKHAVRVITEGLRQEVKPCNIPQHQHFTRCRCDGASEQHHRTGHRQEHPRFLRAVRTTRGVVRTDGGVCD